jgi:hypothetical protein
LREAWSLIAGGMRVRAARNRQPGLGANVRLAGLLAAALWYGQAISVFLSGALNPQALPAGSPAAVVWAACAAGGCLAIISAWFGRPGLTITVSLAAATISALALRQIHELGVLPFAARQIAPPLALAALATGKDRPPRSWLCLPATWLAAWTTAVFLTSAATNALPMLPVDLGFWLIAVTTVIWAITDIRPAIAAGLCFQATYLTGILYPSAGPINAGQIRNLALLTTALAAGSLRSRRKGHRLTCDNPAAPTGMAKPGAGR